MLKTQSDRLTEVTITYRDDGTIIRNMRTASANDNAPRIEENYLIQALNILRASKTLLEISGVDADVYERGIDDIARKLINANKTEHYYLDENKCLQILKEINAKALKVLKETGVGKKYKETEENLLSIAKNFSGLEDEHPDVLTISSLQDSNGNYYAQYSKKLCELTDKQKNQYEDLSGQQWYNILPEWKKKLVEKYKDKITDGKHIIPTQIRDIPGLRNGYTTTIVTCSNKSDVQKTLYEFTHSGTIAAFSTDSEQNKRMAYENLKQLPQDNLHFVTLNTDSLLEREEQECVAQTRDAVEQHNQSVNKLVANSLIGYVEESLPLEQLDNELKKIKSSNTPTNVFRMLFKGEYSEIKYFLNDIASRIKGDGKHGYIKSSDDKLGVTKGYLEIRGNDRVNKAKNEINKIEGESVKNFLTSALELKQLIKKYDGFFGKIRTLFAGRDNSSLKIDLQFIELQQSLGELKSSTAENDYLDISGIKQEHIHVACKSGKDRTGLVGFAIAVDCIKRDSGKGEREVAEVLSMAGHVQYLAGTSGGTPGCIGLKPLLFSIPKSWGVGVAENLQLNTAAFNQPVPRPSIFSHFVIVDKPSRTKTLLDNNPINWVRDKLSSIRNHKAGYEVLPEDDNLFEKKGVLDDEDEKSAFGDLKPSLDNNPINWARDKFSSVRSRKAGYELLSEDDNLPEEKELLDGEDEKSAFDDLNLGGVKGRVSLLQRLRAWLRRILSKEGQESTIVNDDIVLSDVVDTKGTKEKPIDYAVYSFGGDAQQLSSGCNKQPDEGYVSGGEEEIATSTMLDETTSVGKVNEQGGRER